MFPFKIYESDILKDALFSFELPKSLHKKLKKLFQDRTFRKAVLYIFWVFVALKFALRSVPSAAQHHGVVDEVVALASRSAARRATKKDKKSKTMTKEKKNFVGVPLGYLP